MYNYNDIMNDFKKMKWPYEFQHIKLDKFFNNDYYWMMSIRKDAAKTTNALGLGLILNKRYGKTIEYVRCDESQIKKSATETMFDVIKKFDYIPRLWDNEYNTIVFKPMTKKWYLAFVEDGVVKKQCESPVCVLHSLENYIDIKSTYNNPVGDYIILDEIFDSARSSFNQMVELQNEISTIGRERPECRVMMLGNNTSMYSFWYEEFCIEEEIKTLQYGGWFEKKTELGTTLYCELLEISEKKKEEQRQKKIRFAGFNTPKMAAFNGLATWQGSAHQHLPTKELLNSKHLITKRFYIHHRNRYAQIEYYYEPEEFGEFCFVHYSNKPLFHDNIILSINPKNKWEIFGYGKFCENKHIQDVIFKILGMRTEGKWYYATNSVGDLIDDYVKEMD